MLLRSLALKSLRMLNLGSCQQINDACFTVLAGRFFSMKVSTVHCFRAVSRLGKENVLYQRQSKASLGNCA